LSRIIIALGGRKHSGKTEFTKVAKEFGFIRVSMADPLKRYTAKLFDWPIDDMYSQERKEELLLNPVKFGKEECLKLRSIVGCDDIPLPLIDTIIKTKRYALQFLGSEVLRSYNKDFHIKKMIESLPNEGKFVCDDIRFMNELDALKKEDCFTVHIGRPYYFDYSNHISEISLNRNDFEYHIVNDGTLNKLNKKCRSILWYITSKHKNAPNKQELKSSLIKHKYNTVLVAQKYNRSRDFVIWWCERLGIPIIRNDYKLNHDAFLKRTKESAYWAGLLAADGCIKINPNKCIDLCSIDRILIEGFRKFLKTDKPIYKKDKKYSGYPNGSTSYNLVVNSPLLIDDMKLWSLEPRKTQHTKVPEWMSNNLELFYQWLVGFIDGDGSIYMHTQNKSPVISILVSQELIDFLKIYIQIPFSVSSEKGINNLFNIRYNGKNAIALYTLIYKGGGLKRKWLKMKEFV